MATQAPELLLLPYTRAIELLDGAEITLTVVTPPYAALGCGVLRAVRVSRTDGAVHLEATLRRLRACAVNTVIAAGKPGVGERFRRELTVKRVVIGFLVAGAGRRVHLQRDGVHRWSSRRSRLSGR